MCRIDDCDSAQVHRAENRRAAKDHGCDECGRTISKGEQYRYTFAVYEGDPSTWRTCLHCLEAAQWLVRECGGYIIGEICDELDEHAAEYPHCAAGLAPLIAGIRAKWQADGVLMPLPEVPAVTTHEMAD